jgi:non-specific serine/threonine protein kinase
LSIAGSLDNLGVVALIQGDYQAARTLFEQSLSINREMGNRAWEASNLIHLGIVAQEQDDYATAKTLLDEGLVISRELEDKRGIANLLEAIARLAVEQNQPERAARLLGAADALREAIGCPLPPNAREEYDRALSDARKALDKEAFAQSWGEGRTMTMEEAIAYALENNGKVP